MPIPHRVAVPVSHREISSSRRCPHPPASCDGAGKTDRENTAFPWQGVPPNAEPHPPARTPAGTLLYSPIKKNSTLRRKISTGTHRKYPYYPAFWLYYPVKPGKTGNRGPYRAPFSTTQDRPHCGQSRVDDPLESSSCLIPEGILASRSS